MIKNLRTTPVPPTSSAQPKLNLLFKNYEVDRKEKKRKKYKLDNFFSKQNAN